MASELANSPIKPRLHEHQVPNPDSNLDHNTHGRGGLSLDLNPVCLRVNTTSLDQDLDQNPCVNGALESNLKETLMFVISRLLVIKKKLHSMFNNPLHLPISPCATLFSKLSPRDTTSLIISPGWLGRSISHTAHMTSVSWLQLGTDIRTRSLRPPHTHTARGIPLVHADLDPVDLCRAPVYVHTYVYAAIVRIQCLHSEHVDHVQTGTEIRKSSVDRRAFVRYQVKPLVRLPVHLVAECEVVHAHFSELRPREVERNGKERVSDHHVVLVVNRDQSDGDSDDDSSQLLLREGTQARRPPG